MADLLIWLVAALGAVGGVVLGRVWGRSEGKRAGKREAERDAMEDRNNRVERGRDAVRDGRGAGDPADRLIGATALHHHAPLITSDAKLRAILELETIW